MLYEVPGRCQDSEQADETGTRCYLTSVNDWKDGSPRMSQSKRQWRDWPSENGLFGQRFPGLLNRESLWLAEFQPHISAAHHWIKDPFGTGKPLKWRADSVGPAPTIVVYRRETADRTLRRQGIAQARGRIAGRQVDPLSSAIARCWASIQSRARNVHDPPSRGG